jgi:hypothetical protein
VLFAALELDVKARRKIAGQGGTGMLKKGSDKKYFAMLLAHGARGDIESKNGITAAEIMRKKKDPQFHAMADQLRVGG